MKLLSSTPFRYAIRFLLGLIIVILIYFLTALTAGSFSANSAWKQRANGVDIYVETNGIHVSLIVPLKNDGGLLSNKLQASHMKYPQYHSQYAMIGWGHKGVYQNAEDWNDLTVSDAASAVFGTGDALLHIYYREALKPNEYRKKIRISREQYQHIINNIAGYFRYDKNGKLNVYNGYGANDIFYAAKGSYSAINTCNVWAGRIFREAGVRIGYWTPFSQSIMWRFD